MSVAPLHLAIGLASFVVLLGILVNLTGKVADVVNRVLRIEDKPGIVPR